MATLIDADKVKYLCNCKRLKPLCYLYYCKYCKPFTLKCKDCVLHEIDSKYFCANCFENKAQKEIAALKYKCANCFSCPYCKNLLMIRASSIKSRESANSTPVSTIGSSQSSPSLPVQSITEGTTPTAPTPTQQSPQTPSSQPQKVFYLMCGFCRWTTRDVGIPDVTTAPSGWKLQENKNSKRIQELLDAYKILSAKEKLEKDRKKYPTIKRRTFHLVSGSNTSSTSPSSLLHTDKYGILAPAQKRLQLATSGSVQSNENQLTFDQQFKALIKPAETVDSFEKLPEEFYTKEMNVNSITSINQRHINPEFQPAKSSDLYPLNKFYQCKESKRCSGCEHNVLKPESNITSIKFKLHQMAIFLVPEVRIVSIPEWVLNQPNEVILSITNRYESDVNIGFLNIQNDPQSKNLSGFNPTAIITFDPIDSETSITIDRQDNAKAQAAALKPSDFETNGFVCFRRDNKIAVRVKVTPFKSEQASGKIDPVNVKCMFGLKVSTNMSDSNLAQTPTTNSPALPEQLSNSIIVHKIYIDFGPMKKENGLKVIPTPRYIDECLRTSIKS